MSFLSFTLPFFFSWTPPLLLLLFCVSQLPPSLSSLFFASTGRHARERITGKETLIGMLLFLNRRMVGWMKCPFGLNKQMTGWTKCPFGWMTGWIQGKLLSSTSLLYLATVRSYCPSGLRGSFILPLLYVIWKLVLHGWRSLIAVQKPCVTVEIGLFSNGFSIGTVSF